jgi:outer membrane protein OmpA-like peptidoglycan-associated protein
MMRAIFYVTVALLFLIASPSGAQELEQGNRGYVIVTVPEVSSHGAGKRIRNHRIQLFDDSTFVSVRLAQSRKLPSYHRRVRFRYRNPNGRNSTVSLRNETVMELLEKEQDSVLNMHYSDNARDSVKYKKASRQFLRHRNGGDLMKHQWHSVSISRKPVGQEKLNVKIKTSLFHNLTLTTDTLPAIRAARLPAIDIEPCVPLERFYKRKELYGYGLGNYSYQEFSLSQRKIVRKSFELYFPKNSADVAVEDVDPVITYLKKNDLSILSVTIEGYASVEGDSLLNRKLQQKRAQRLISLLQAHNGEPIQARHIFLGEQWDEFRTSIRNTSYRWLDTLSNAAIQLRLNADPLLIERVEPYLKPLRMGRLSITMSSRFSQEEMFDQVQEEFNRTCAGLAPAKPPATTLAAERKLMGMFAYVDRLTKTSLSPSGKLAQLADESPYPEQTRILLFYHAIKHAEEGDRSGAYPLWDSVFASHQWNNIFLVANENILSLIGAARTAEEKNRRMRQAVDIQHYMLKYIEAGKLAPEAMCSISYPDNTSFYGLLLNHYAMAEKLAEQFFLPCFGFPKRKVKTVYQPEPFTAENLKALMMEGSSVVSHSKGVRSPTFDKSEKGDYYYFLKKLFLTRDKSILDFVRRSDTMSEFDLLHFLRITVSAWDPLANHYYDSAVQLAEMNQLIQELKRRDALICKRTVNQLYLDYHHKALLHLNTHLKPGSREQVKIADTSLDFISRYYQRRAHLLFPRLTLFITDALHYFYALPTGKPSTAFAYRILTTFSAYRMPDEAEQMRLDLYKRMHDLKGNARPTHQLMRGGPSLAEPL